MIFSFIIDDALLSLAAHAMSNHQYQRNPYESTKPEAPALMLVKDHGVYLMSPFTDKDAPRSARLYEPPTHDPQASVPIPSPRLVVVYAEGHDPDKDKDYWIGGDDFGENLAGLPALILRGVRGSKVNVTVNSQTIEFSVEVLKAAKQAAKQAAKPKRRK